MAHRILLIDDDPQVLLAMTASLKWLSHFDVQGAEDGVQGLEQVESFHPDCVVVDVKMPHLDGIQFIRAMRGDPATATIPLIILSAMQQERDKLEGTLAGTDRYLVKPVEPYELVRVIGDVVAISNEQRIARMRVLAEEGEHV